MKNFWVKNKLYLSIIIYVIVFVVLAYFLGWFLINRIKTVSNKIQETLSDQKIEEGRLSSLPQMEKDWQSYNNQKDLADVILSPGSEISFIESIDSIAQKSGNVIDLKIGDEVDPKEIAKIKNSAAKEKGEKGIMDEISYTNYFPMQINLRGNYQGLVNFIHMLENGRFYVNIISINSKKITEDTVKPAELNNSNDSEGAEENQPQEIILTSINAIVYTQK